MRSWRRLSGLVTLGLAGGAAAEPFAIREVAYPSLPQAAADAAGFAPPGWQVERRAEGDLDGDGRIDLAFVIRSRDPANILANEGLGEPVFDTNPRILAIALRGADGPYRLVVQDHALIPRRRYPTQQDPFDETDSALTIENRTLKLVMPRFWSAGSWSMGPVGFTFRWQDGAMRLIGYDYDNIQRNSGESTSISVNFLTGRARIDLGNMESDDEDVRWIRIERRPLLALEEVGDGLAFDPQGLVAGLP
ncbi:hypothetical protein [Sphingosinicella terrae]|uniref:hypothetical protein n=1 Tax=Sphingosinicella terrae TaxID=2172047 RepID=UPI000E0D2CC3|nr:hypothetical protein [Sphingosinicella terrae]